jgi:hypothetical protein
MKFLAIILFIICFFPAGNQQNEKQDNTLAPLDKLKAGNEKFVSGHPAHPNEHSIELKN